MASPSAFPRVSLNDVFSPDLLETIQESHRPEIARSVQAYLTRFIGQNAASIDTEIQLQQLRIELEETKNANNNYQRVAQESQGQASVLETRLQLLKNDDEESHRRLNEFTEREQLYIDKLTENQRILSRFYDDIRGFEQEQSRLNERNIQLTTKLFDAEQNGKQALSRSVELEKQTGDLKAQLNRTNGELDREKRSRDTDIAERVRNERQKFEQQLQTQHAQEVAALRKTVSDLEMRCTGAQSTEEMLRQRIEAFEKVLDGNRQVKTKIEEHVADLHNKYANTLSGKDIALATYQQEIALMNREVSTARRQMDELHTKVDASEQELHAQKAHYEDLLQIERKQVRDLTQKFDVARAELETNSRALTVLQNLPNSSAVSAALFAGGNDAVSSRLSQQQQQYDEAESDDGYLHIEQLIQTQLRELAEEDRGGNAADDISNMFKLLTRTTLTLKQSENEVRYLRRSLDEILEGAKDQVAQYVRLNTEFEAREQLFYQLKDQLFALDNDNMALSKQLRDADHVIHEFSEYLYQMQQNDLLLQQLATVLSDVNELRQSGGAGTNAAAPPTAKTGQVVQTVQQLRLHAKNLAQLCERYRTAYADGQNQNQSLLGDSGDFDSTTARKRKSGATQQQKSAEKSVAGDSRAVNIVAPDNDVLNAAQQEVVKFQQEAKHLRLERDSFRSACMDPIVAEFIGSLCRSERACVVFGKLVDSFDTMQNFADAVRNAAAGPNSVENAEQQLNSSAAAMAAEERQRLVREQLDLARKSHEAALSNCQRRIEALQTDLQTARDELFTLRSSEQQLKIRCAEFEGVATALRTQMAALNEQKSVAATFSEQRGVQLVRAEEHLRQQQDRLNVAEQNAQVLQAELEKQKSVVQQAKRVEQQLRKQHAELQRENEETTQLVKTLQSLQQDDAGRRANGAAAFNSGGSEDFWHQQANSLQERCDALNKTLEVKNEHYDALQRAANEKFEAMEQQLKQVQREVNVKESTLKYLQDELMRLSSEQQLKIAKAEGFDTDMKSTSASTVREQSSETGRRSPVDNLQQSATAGEQQQQQQQQQQSGSSSSTSLIWENVKLKRQLAESASALEVERKHVAEFDVTLSEIKRAFDLDRSKFETDLKRLTEQVQAKTSEVDDAEKLCANLQNRLNSLEASLQIKLDMLKRASNELADGKQQGARERMQLEEHARHISSTLTKLEDVREQDQKLTAQLQQSIVPSLQECDDLRRRVAQLQDEINAARAKADEFERESANREAVLEAERQLVTHRAESLRETLQNVENSGKAETTPTNVGGGSLIMIRYTECERKLRLLEDEKFAVDLDRASLRAQSNLHQSLITNLRAQLDEQDKIFRRTSSDFLTSGDAGSNAASLQHRNVIIQALSASNVQLLSEQQQVEMLCKQSNRSAASSQQQLELLRVELMDEKTNTSVTRERLNLLEDERRDVDRKLMDLQTQCDRQLQEIGRLQAEPAAAMSRNDPRQTRATIEDQLAKIKNQADKIRKLQDLGIKLKAEKTGLEVRVAVLEKANPAGGPSSSVVEDSDDQSGSKHAEIVKRYEEQIAVQAQHASNIEASLARAESRSRELDQLLKEARNDAEASDLRVQMIESKYDRDLTSMKLQVSRLQAEIAALQQRLAVSVVSTGVVLVPPSFAAASSSSASGPSGSSVEAPRRSQEQPFAAAAQQQRVPSAELQQKHSPPPFLAGQQVEKRVESQNSRARPTAPALDASSGGGSSGASSSVLPVRGLGGNSATVREEGGDNIQQPPIFGSRRPAGAPTPPSSFQSTLPSTTTPAFVQQTSLLFSVARGGSALLPLNSIGNNLLHQQQRGGSVAGGSSSDNDFQQQQQQQPLQEPSQSGIGFGGGGGGSGLAARPRAGESAVSQPLLFGRGTKRSMFAADASGSGAAAGRDIDNNNDADSVAAVEPTLRMEDSSSNEVGESSRTIPVRQQQQREASPGSALLLAPRSPLPAPSVGAPDDVASTTDEIPAATVNFPPSSEAGSSRSLAGPSGIKRVRLLPSSLAPDNVTPHQPQPAQHLFVSDHASIGSPTSVSSTSGGSALTSRAAGPIMSTTAASQPPSLAAVVIAPVDMPQQQPSSSSGSLSVNNVLPRQHVPVQHDEHEFESAAATAAASNVAADGVSSFRGLSASSRAAGLRLRRPRQPPLPNAAVGVPNLVTPSNTANIVPATAFQQRQQRLANPEPHADDNNGLLSSSSGDNGSRRVVAEAEAAQMRPAVTAAASAGSSAAAPSPPLNLNISVMQQQQQPEQLPTSSGAEGSSVDFYGASSNSNRYLPVRTAATALPLMGSLVPPPNAAVAGEDDDDDDIVIIDVPQQRMLMPLALQQQQQQQQQQHVVSQSSDGSSYAGGGVDDELFVNMPGGDDAEADDDDEEEADVVEGENDNMEDDEEEGSESDSESYEDDDNDNGDVESDDDGDDDDGAGHGATGPSGNAGPAGGDGVDEENAEDDNDDDDYPDQGEDLGEDGGGSGQQDAVQGGSSGGGDVEMQVVAGEDRVESVHFEDSVEESNEGESMDASEEEEDCDADLAKGGERECMSEDGESTNESEESDEEEEGDEGLEEFPCAESYDADSDDDGSVDAELLTVQNVPESEDGDTSRRSVSTLSRVDFRDDGYDFDSDDDSSSPIGKHERSRSASILAKYNSCLSLMQHKLVFNTPPKNPTNKCDKEPKLEHY